MKWIAAALVVVLLAPVAAWSWLREQPGPGAPGVRAESTQSRTDSDPSDADALAIPSAFARATIETHRSHPDGIGPADSARGLEGTVSVEVAIVEVDADGIEHRDRAGSFEFSRGNDYETVHFESGLCSVGMAPEDRWTIQEVSIDARRTSILGNPSDQPLSPSRRIELRVRRWAETILHVVDASSKAELTDIELVTTDYDTGAVPSDHRVPFTRSPTSPVRLVGGPSGQVAWFIAPHVRAAGHAWKRTFLDLRLGGEHTVELHPGGDAEIEVRGLDAERKCSLVVRTLDEDEMFADAQTRLREEGVVRIDSLRVGRNRATVMLGESFHLGEEIGHVDFTVPSEGVARVALALPRLPPVVDADLSGTLTIDPAWRLGIPWIQIERVEESFRVNPRQLEIKCANEASDGHFCTWSAGQIEVGSHLLSVPLGAGIPPWTHVVEVGAEGVRDLALVIGRPNDVTIRVLDGATGNDADVSSVGWQVRGLPGLVQREGNVTKDAASGLFGFQAPAGALSVSITEPAHVPLKSAFEVSADQHTFVLTATRLSRIEITFTNAGPGLDLRAGLECDSIKADDEDAHADLGDPTANTVVIECSAGGRYRVSGLHIPHYEIVPDFEVDAVLGQTLRHTIRLTPLK